MKILIYENYDYLPFSAARKFVEDCGKNEVISVFDPVNIDSWTYSQWETGEHIPFRDKWAYPIFQAISQLDIFNDTIAHFSFKFNHETHLCYSPQKFWVQFSNLPQFIDGIPQVFNEDKELLVHSLWLNENPTLEPYGLLNLDCSKFDPLIHTVDFWKQWFLKSLLDHRDREINDAMATITAANRTIDHFRSMC